MNPRYAILLVGFGICAYLIGLFIGMGLENTGKTHTTRLACTRTVFQGNVFLNDCITVKK